jgi:hypothetical protein
MTYVIGYDEWKKVFISDARYKHSIWIYTKLSNNQEVYLRDYDEWLSFGDYCKEHKVSINKIGLRYRSHQIEVDSSESEGVYVVRSVKGEFGASTKQCFTIGLLKGGIVDKTMWLTPELIEESKIKDKLEDCFAEGLIYNYAYNINSL